VARRASSTMIGAFVVGAVALGVVALTVFGSGRLLQHRPTLVMFFSGSITGLSVGSPVEFRGVKVGEVTKIAAVFDPETVNITIPVYVEFDPKSLIVSGGDRKLLQAKLDAGSLYQPLLDKGLKAQLDIQSLITRQLYVSLDFHPEIPPRLVGRDAQYPEIPTIPSIGDKIQDALQKLPDKIVRAADGIERLVNSPAVQGTVQDLGVALRDLDLLIRDVRTEVKPVAASLRRSSDAAQRTFAQAERTLSLKEGPAAELAASLTDTIKKAGASLEQLHATLGAYERVAAQNGNVGYDLTRTLGDVDAAAHAVRSLAEYVELHPEAVLNGRR
jgi:phospholipid/cholesterol/gamma-HCH transport system substrate-binding protein